jgi:hypothetical protein
VEGDIDLRHVHGARPARQHRVVRREIAPRRVADERAFDEVGSRQAERPEDALLERVAQRRPGRLLDEQPQDDVVAAVIRPTLARGEQARQLHHQPELLARVELPAVAEVPAIRLEEFHDIPDEIRQAARVVQKLAHGDALSERCGVVVELEQPLVHELEDERGDEDLRHAPDAEAMIDREWLARADVREPGGCLDPPRRADGHGHCARNSGCDDGVELIPDGIHLQAREPNRGC